MLLLTLLLLLLLDKRGTGAGGGDGSGDSGSGSRPGGCQGEGWTGGGLGCDKVGEHGPLRATAGCGHQECRHFLVCVWRVSRVEL